MIEVAFWGVTVCSIVGTVANIYGRRWCFVVWMITNLLWAEYDMYKAAYPQAVLMVFYAILAAWGYKKWENTPPPSCPAAEKKG